MKIKPKAPPETKAQLMEKTVDALQKKYGTDPYAALLFTLNFFTAVDLVEILKELK